MHTLATLQLDNLVTWLPFFVIGTGALIVAVVFYFRHERRRLWHETARLALEKGQPLPLSIQDQDNASESKSKPSPLQDLRTALILIALGIALRYEGLPGAYITGGIGLALLLFAAITALFAPKSSDTTPRTPQA